MDDPDQLLSAKQAHLAMYAFLDQCYRRFGFDDLGVLLGGMSVLPDGSTADPAAWEDWLRAVENGRAGQVDARLNLSGQGEG